MSSATDVNVVELVDSVYPGPTSPEFPTDSGDPIKHFHLNENPFLDNVNPDYFFRTQAHEEAYLKMKKCIEDDVSMGLITARSGTGKTLLTQILLQELDEGRYCPALILAYPRLSRTALLKELANELEIDRLPSRITLHDLISAVQDKIHQIHREGKKPVFIIDEVHFLGGDTLHLLRTLSNIETAQRKLVTILLFGEESFIEKLKKPKYQAILSRAFIRAHLRPLTPDEVEQYVKFRCLMAGGKIEIFEGAVYQRIHEVTEGIPRDINRLCLNALLIAAAAHLPRITPAVLEECLCNAY